MYTSNYIFIEKFVLMVISEDDVILLLQGKKGWWHCNHWLLPLCMTITLCISNHVCYILCISRASKSLRWLLNFVPKRPIFFIKRPKFNIHANMKVKCFSNKESHMSSPQVSHLAMYSPKGCKGWRRFWYHKQFRDEKA